jgi:hypothetical protein
MSAKKIKVGPNQPSLFTSVGPGHTANPILWKPGEKAAAVNIVERDQRLVEVLRAFGKISQKRGLAKAIVTPPRDMELVNRWGVNTDERVAGALRNADDAEKAAKWPFAFATGRYVVVESGLLTNEGAVELADEMFNDYLGKYAGPGDNQVARDAEIRRLEQHSKAFSKAQSSQKAS